MNQHIICDGATRYHRITKQAARKLFNAGEGFYIIAHKMRPGFPFSLGMTIDSDRIKRERSLTPAYPTPESLFDATVTEFCWYNSCRETGTYAAFYRTENVSHEPMLQMFGAALKR